MCLTPARFLAGLWEGILTGADPYQSPPVLRAALDGEPIDGIEVSAQQADGWCVRLPIPVGAIADGVQDIAILGPGDICLTRITLICGHPAGHDLRAEVAMLRAELTLLKRAFRRHCTDGVPGG